MAKGLTSDRSVAEALLQYVNASHTEFHAVAEAKKLLNTLGYVELFERSEWKSLAPGGKYFFSRNGSTLLAFAIGGQYKPGNGFYIIGAHTDSPCFKLRPVTRSVKSGYGMLHCEPYGGLLQHTWFDRDLSVAGRVLVEDSKSGSLEHRLVHVPRPVARIPMLSIHLQREISDQGFNPNKQTQCTPLLFHDAAKKESSLSEEEFHPDVASRHHPELVRLLARELGCETRAIVGFDLNLVDTQPGQLWGMEEEYVAVGRLDNLCSSFLAVRALMDADASLAQETGVRVAVLFDNEEIGSGTAQGAAGTVLHDALVRVAGLLAGDAEAAVERAAQSSFLLSADMAHALHPNFPEKHDADTAPRLGDGVVVKHNANQRYATTAPSAALFRRVCGAAGVPCADFTVRADMACGSTIGPILAAGVGLRTVDVGLPQLAMHSIREMCAVSDVGAGYRAFLSFYEKASALDAQMSRE